MPRNISFSMTEPQFVDGSKDVTRRMGWKWLKPGDRIMGVRKAGATFAAEEGATVRDLMEMFGWRNEAEAVLYTRAASAIRLSDSAGRALERGLIGNTVLSHPISGATKSGKK